MKSTLKLSVLLVSVLLFSACGNSENENKQIILVDTDHSKNVKSNQGKSSKDMVDLSNKGVGPITSLNLNDDINADLALKGKEVFDNMCIACHRVDRKFIGPKIEGVTKMRAPEWIMNMILNPEGMIKNDPIAKQLLIESNMAIMTNQNLKEEEARAILEYFRQIDQ